MAWSALAIMMKQTMALRSSDLTRRVVRDIDLGGAQLQMSGGKTENSNRPRHIPTILQPFVRELIKDRPPFDPLFKTPYTESGLGVSSSS